MNSAIGVGPMSRLCIEAAVEYSNEHQEQIMLIASRRQVECRDFGGGYVDNLSSEHLVERVNMLGGKNVVICRDHSGPYQGLGEKGMSADEALERAAHSMQRDVEAGFGLIHVDCSYYTGDVYSATERLIDTVMSNSAKNGSDVLLEVGTEENTGEATDLAKFRTDLDFVTAIATPHFVVGQTGSLVKETFQVGYFDYEATAKLAEETHSRGLKFKEHNVDYTPQQELELRQVAGVDAVNVAPEFGVVQTRTIESLARRFGLHKEFRRFLELPIQGDWWRKWAYGQPFDYNKGIVAGHYFFGSPEYYELEERLSAEVDVAGIVKSQIKQAIDRYVRALQ